MAFPAAASSGISRRSPPRGRRPRGGTPRAAAGGGYGNPQQQQQSNHASMTRSRAKWALMAVAAVAVLLGLARHYMFQQTVFLPPGDGKIRVFGPSYSAETSGNHPNNADDDPMTVQTFTPSEQRAYLEQNGYACQQSFATGAGAESSLSSSKNLLTERFDTLPAAYATELWKYCVLYLGTANVYWDSNNALPLMLWEDILDEEQSRHSKTNWAISLPDDTTNGDPGSLQPPPPLHHSFLQIREPHSKTALGMMRFLLETSTSVTLTPTLLQETLALFVANDLRKKQRSWQFWTASCQDAPVRTKSWNNNDSSSSSSTPPIVLHTKAAAHASSSSSSSSSALQQPQSYLVAGEPCAAPRGEPCCQVFRNDSDDVPIAVLRHAAWLAQGDSVENPRPFAIVADSETHSAEATARMLQDSSTLGMPAADLPYIATVRAFPTHAPPATVHETPNYFDILLRNNCLPHDKECFKCLKLGYKEGDEGGDCHVCAAKCPCYCNALCQVRPPPKRLAAVWEVTPPRYRRDPGRIIPRVIHQTWFEPVTQEKYPNMSRLIESFRQSGWEYTFYDDDSAAQFLSAHFPPAVREAYDALIPGAFKADLFRYCVLLIRGGVYADMDILLESNLDQAIDGSIGFLTAQDSPGETIGHRSCLWNGFMAAAPGHPFLAQTIQNVVNNVRNRFTSVDYDDMLCPNPVLSISHTVDTLFTCGPCILGASLNDVLHRHRQTGFEYGEIDLFETEKKQQRLKDSGSNKRITVSIDPDDPRLLIPGRSLLLKQNKEDMGSHRFTHEAANLIVAATDMPEYDDRPKSIEHYSKSHVKFGVYGLTKLYHNSERANEEVVLRVVQTPGARIMS